MTKKFDIAKFCGKDKMKPIFGGVHYENGRACASDAGVLAYVRTRYDQTNEGKTIHPNGYEIQGKYPNVSGLVESVSKQNTVCVKLDLALLVTACSWCKKDLFTIVSIPVPMPDGKIIKVGFDFKRLFLIVDACITFGIREARFSPVYTERKAMILSNAYADFLIMPVMREGDEISLDGTISLTIQRRSELAELAGVYERTAEASEGRKAQAAAKTAEYIRDLLEKADEGRWMDPAALYGPNEVAAWWKVCKTWEYFRRENMEAFENEFRAPELVENAESLTVYRAYGGENRWWWTDRPENLWKGTESAPMDAETRRKLAEACKEVRAAFEKRLAAWWKRYGADRLHCWTYWRDA